MKMKTITCNARREHEHKLKSLKMLLTANDSFELSNCSRCTVCSLVGEKNGVVEMTTGGKMEKKKKIKLPRQ